MGRTVPPYRLALEEELKRWERFGKALRSGDREAFEEVVEACRRYASAASMATRPLVFEAMVMSVLVAQQKALKEIREELDDLRKKLSQLQEG